MFFCDRGGHLSRHGIKFDGDSIDEQFVAGEEDTPARVGGNYRPLRRTKANKGKHKEKGS